MRVWQILFGLLLIASLWYAASLKFGFNLDTGLADVAPSIGQNQQIAEAIDVLQADIQQRILLLVSGEDEEAVAIAAEELRTRLSLSEHLTVLAGNDELFDRIAQQVLPYRFDILNRAQVNYLDSSSSSAIVERTERDLYSLADARVYPFKQDPFGLSGDALLALISQLTPPTPQQAGDAYESVSLLLGNQALSMQQQRLIEQSVSKAIKQVSEAYSVSVDRSGVFFFATHAAQQSKQDISVISTVSTITIVLLLLVVFRSVTALILPILSVVIGVAFAFTVTHWVYGSVHVLTIVFGASLIGIVIDYSLHYFYHSGRSEQDFNGGDLAHSKAESTALHKALLLSLCTSIIGYAALSFSGLAALQKVALFSCSGLLMSWLCVVSLGRRWVHRRLKVATHRLAKVVELFFHGLAFVTTKIALALASIIVLASALVWFFSSPVSDDPRAFFSAPESLLASERRVAEKSNDFEPGQYLVIWGKDADVIQTKYLQLISQLKNFPSVSVHDLSSLLAVTPNLEHQTVSYRAQTKLYSQGGALDLLASELNLTPAVVEQLKRSFFDAEQNRLGPGDLQAILDKALPPMWFSGPDSSTAFILVRKGVNAKALGSLTADLAGVEYVNTVEQTTAALAAQRQSASVLLLLAYLLVSIILVTRFRSVSAAVMVLVPIVSSATVILAAGVLGFELNLFHFMALFLVLGFGMDYAIFVREMQTHQSRTLQAILLSALTSLLSFGLLSLSSIPLVASFGLALLIGNTMNLLGAFVYSAANQRYLHPKHNEQA